MIRGSSRSQAAGDVCGCVVELPTVPVFGAVATCTRLSLEAMMTEHWKSPKRCYGAGAAG